MKINSEKFSSKNLYSKKTMIFGIILILELIVFAYIARYDSGSNHVSYSFDDADMSVNEDSEVSSGCYIDTSYSGSTRSISTPQFNLSKGIYMVTVTYQTNAPQSDSKVQAYSRMFPNNDGTCITDNTMLWGDGETKTSTYKVYVKYDSTFDIRSYISDDATEGIYLLVTDVDVDYLYSDTLLLDFFTLFIIFIIIDLVLYFYIFRKEKFDLFLSQNGAKVLALLAITFVACMPLMNKNIIKGHDIWFSLNRLEGLAEGLKSGQFPVRVQPYWFGNLGYAVSIYYGELFMYPAAFLRVIGFDLQFCYKIFITYMNLLTALIAYFSFKKMSGKDYIALSCSLVYTLGIYRVMDIYTRSAVGEFSALTFMPLLALGLYEIYYLEKNSYLKVTFAMSFIIQSHMLSCIMVTMFVVVFAIWNFRKTFTKRVLINIVKSVLSILLLNAWFIVPFLDYHFNVTNRLSGIARDVSGTGIYLSQLFASVYNVYGLSGDNSFVDEMPLSIGIASVIVIAMFASSVCYIRCSDYKDAEHKDAEYKADNDKKKFKMISSSLIILFILSVYMASIEFPYKWFESAMPSVYSVLSVVQYVWRYLAIASIVVACMMCFAAVHLEKKFDKGVITAMLMIICAVALYQNVDYNGQVIADSDKLITARDMATNSYNFESTEYLTAEAGEIYDVSVHASSDSVAFETTSEEGLEITLSVTNSSTEDAYIEVPRVCYKGYVAYLDGERVSVTSGDNGRVRVAIPAGFDGELVVRFEEPIYYRISELVSIGFLVFIIVWNKREKKAGNKA